MNRFFQQFQKLFQIKASTDKQYEKVVYQQGLDQIKFEMMKLKVLYDTLPVHMQKYLDQFVKGEKLEGNFTNLISKSRESFKERLNPNTYDELVQKEIDYSWVGTRLEVELP